jgi:hypothetical protein
VEQQGKSVKVSAVMTAPRYECVQARSRIERSLGKAGIPLTISGGVFYHQCMQTMCEDLVGKVDYIVTVDFDSMFLPKHVVRLLSLAANIEEIDCVAALQPMRGKGRVLGSKRHENRIEWDGNPVKVDSAHFGLTVIDAKKLEQLPKPWFVCKPDPNGSWSDDRIDSDVWFWRQWEKAGFSCYMDPACRIGHLEELVTVYDEQMQPVHYYPSKWEEVAVQTCE